MRQFTCLLILLLALSACGQNAEAVLRDDIQIGFSLEAEPAFVGETVLLITVQDSNGTEIDKARVSVQGNMDHEGMTPVDSSSSTSVNGVYRIPFEWTMGGGWILDVEVQLPDNQGIAQARFEVFVEAISQNSIVNHGDTSNNTGFSVHFEADNEPAYLGDGEGFVTVTDAGGQIIEDAQVSLHATMQGHHMLPLDEESQEIVAGRYRIPIRWTMAGEWQVEITVTLADGRVLNETFEQTVSVDN